MMYCGNSAETADESKTKSRQIACERVEHTEECGERCEEAHGSWNATMTGVGERGAKVFQGSKILAKTSGRGKHR